MSESIKPKTGTTQKIAVIGGGIIGSWAAKHLLEAGADTTLIEQFPLPHSRGSSHGMSRAFRYLGELEMGRLDYSLKRWQDLEKESGTRLFVRTGLINFGPPGDPDLEKYMEVLRDHNRPCEWLDTKSISLRYPSIRYPDHWGAAWDPNGGILMAHTCLQALHNAFQKEGGKILRARVSHIKADANAGTWVHLSESELGSETRLYYDQLIFAAGAWSSGLISGFSKLLRPVLTPVSYWRDPSGKHSVANGFPILFNARLTGIYALPSYEYPGLVKILYHGGPETDPDRRDQVSVIPYLSKVKEYVREHFPLLDYEYPAILESCMYTMSPDGFPIIDRLDERVTVGCGFSGSGFKHSPATGLMLASIALGQEQDLPQDFGTERYRLMRFDGSITTDS